eukprot:TRINITY_DN57754_c0_g1_i1.p1 TRINITY_DN57754_c0_g1~~TRINITY_DN57754_c0_g1_i1.p1  ORF type:complete len:611 (+),score=120.28 TRINITY_DN57754_c0_g1_i1:43-1833(+)
MYGRFPRCSIVVLRFVGICLVLPTAAQTANPEPPNAEPKHETSQSEAARRCETSLEDSRRLASDLAEKQTQLLSQVAFQMEKKTEAEKLASDRQEQVLTLQKQLAAKTEELAAASARSDAQKKDVEALATSKEKANSDNSAQVAMLLKQVQDMKAQHERASKDAAAKEEQAIKEAALKHEEAIKNVTSQHEKATKKLMAQISELEGKSIASQKEVAQFKRTEAGLRAEVALWVQNATVTKERLSEELQRVTDELTEKFRESLRKHALTRMRMKAAKMEHDEALENMRLKHNIVQQNIARRLEQLTRVHTELQQRFEDPSMVEFLHNRAVKLYETDPVVAGTVNKTYRYIVPRLRIGYARVQGTYEEGATLLNSTRGQIEHKLHAYVTDNKTVVMVSGLLVYGLLFIPLLLSIWLLSSVSGVLKLRPLLLFSHLHIFLTCLLSGLAAVALGLDPLTSFYQEYYGVYLFTQAAVAFFYTAYVLMLGFAFFVGRSLLERCVRIMQFGVVCASGRFYYMAVWARAMLDKPPIRVLEGALSAPWDLALPYLVGTCAFAMVLRLEQHALASRSRSAIEEDSIKISLNVQNQVSEVELSEKQA